MLARLQTPEAGGEAAADQEDGQSSTGSAEPDPGKVLEDVKRLLHDVRQADPLDSLGAVNGGDPFFVPEMSNHIIDIPGLKYTPTSPPGELSASFTIDHNSR